MSATDFIFASSVSGVLYTIDISTKHDAAEVASASQNFPRKPVYMYMPAPSGE